MLWDIEPLGLVFQDFADRAPFDVIPNGDVFLSRAGVCLLIFTDGFSIDVKKALLSLLLSGVDW